MYTLELAKAIPTKPGDIMPGDAPQKWHVGAPGD